ncbi:putative serine/threonine protein kinase, variant 1 [Trichoderma velutinum]
MYNGVEISTTLISENEDETAAFAESYCGDLSVVSRFNLDTSQPLSTSSRIVACFHGIEVDKAKKTFPNRETMRQGIYDSIAYVWPICASNPSIRLPDVIVQIRQDHHGETTCRISHETVFLDYLASLLPVAFVKDVLLRQVRITELQYISLESLQFSDKLGGRGGTTVTRFKDQEDGELYVYKGLGFRLFMEDQAEYKSERDTFYHELEVICSLPAHPNILRAPSLLVTTGLSRSASHDNAQNNRVICGVLYPFLERQSLQEIISQNNESHSRLPLISKAKWAFQISSAMAIVHSSGQYHMDLKPSNMLLNNEDDVVVIDWEQCGASPFFLAPEADGLWDVEVVVNAEPGEVSKTNIEKERMAYLNQHIGPLGDDCGIWPRRDVFQLWRLACRRALEAAEVYSVGRSLWVIFEQGEGVWTYDRRQPEAKAVVWTERSESMPEVWKDFVSRCMSLDPNKRPTFEQGERFWGKEWQRLEGETK